MLINKDLFRTDLPEIANKIICIVPNRLSAAIQASPTLTALRQYYPNAHITLIGPIDCPTLFQETGLIDRYWHLTAQISAHNLRVYTSLITEHFDFLVDLYTPTLEIEKDQPPVLFIKSTLKQHLNVRFFSNPKNSIGFTVDHNHYTSPLRKALKKNFRLSVNIPVPHNHESEHFNLADINLQILIDRKKIEIAKPLFPKKIYDSQKQDQSLRERMPPPIQNIICIYFGGRYKSLHWPIKEAIDCCKKIVASLDASVHIIGGHYEEEYSNIIEASLKEEIKNGTVFNHINQLSLQQTMDVISQSSMIITTLGSPFHIADSYDIPMITIASGTFPIHFYQSRESRQILLKVPVECEGCYLDTCNKTVSCVQHITSRQVIEAINSMISDRFAKTGYK